MKKDILFNLGFWLLIMMVFALSIMRFESSVNSIRIAMTIILPVVIPVYIHHFILNYFIYQKKYFLYILSTAVIISFFGYVTNALQKYLDTFGETEYYGMIVIMMMLYTGASYFRMGTKQRMRLKEAEERRMKAEIEFKELEVKQSQAELNLLRSQVNPHFLFNSLNSIYSLILSNSDLAADTVMKLSELMRYLLDSSTKRKVLVKHELDFLQNYIELEKIRLGKKAKVVSEFKGHAAGKIISPLLLITFIENCFKHGISVHTKDNLIEIFIQVDEKELRLSTSNNIAAKRINPITKKESTGIENVKKRLELLYADKHELEIKTEDQKYKVNFTLKI